MELAPTAGTGAGLGLVVAHAPRLGVVPDGSRPDQPSGRRDPWRFGDWPNATNAEEAREVFRALEASFSEVVEAEISLVAYGVSGDLAYTAHREHTRTSVGGEPRHYTLRVTQVYRYEDGTWKVIHRHGDHETSETA